MPKLKKKKKMNKEIKAAYMKGYFAGRKSMGGGGRNYEKKSAPFPWKNLFGTLVLALVLGLAAYQFGLIIN